MVSGIPSVGITQNERFLSCDTRGAIPCVGTSF